MQNTGLNGIKTSVVSLKIMVVLLRLAMIAKRFRGFRDSRVIGSDRSRFAARSKILAGIEAK